ncbi:MAG: hypothetical protein IT564_01295 [Rhodospirillales bacterium]|nr:hypothetical protein [Rhodospirillales bacterium]
MPDAPKESAAVDALKQGRTEDAVGLFRKFLKTTGFCNLGLCANRDAEWECCANHFQGRLLTLSLTAEDTDYYELARRLGKWIRDRHALEAKNRKKEPPPGKVKLPHGLFVGHPSIDFDHLKLVAALNDIAESIERGNFEDFPTLLNGFLELQAMHFRREEDILEEVAFPGLSENRAVHARLRNEAAGLMKRAPRAGKNKAAQEVMLSELTAILIDDIRDSDLAFKSFLQRKQRIVL